MMLPVPKIGRVEIDNEEIPITFGPLGEFFVQQPLSKGTLLVVYFYAGDDLHSYDVLFVEAIDADKQIRWFNRVNRQISPAERQALSRYLPRRER